MHPHDRLERFVSKHPGSKLHKRGKNLRQKRRDKVVRIKAIRQARVATERDVS